jgi:hypothetical protein
VHTLGPWQISPGQYAPTLAHASSLPLHCLFSVFILWTLHLAIHITRALARLARASIVVSSGPGFHGASWTSSAAGSAVLSMQFRMVSQIAAM